MTDQLKKLAMVPALNEQDKIDWVIGQLNEHAPGFDVLVIDDGSSDNTGERRARRRDRDPPPVQPRHRRRRAERLQARLPHGYDVAVQVDGDGQHDPRELQPMLEHLHTSARPTWSAARGSSREEDGYPAPTRRARDPHLPLVLSLIVGEKITDPTSGFRWSTAAAIELFARDYPHDYPEVEALLMLRAHKLSCTSSRCGCASATRASPRSAHPERPTT